MSAGGADGEKVDGDRGEEVIEEAPAMQHGPVGVVARDDLRAAAAEQQQQMRRRA